MPLFIKNSGVWKSLEQGSVHLKESTLKIVGQIWIKRLGGWQSVWSAENPPEQVADNTVLWGIAQFSDTDFTGGKTDPNQAGDPYTRWTGVQDFISSELVNSDTTGGTVSVALNVPFPEYGYFAHPKSRGIAQFIDDSTGWPGGWDGANWPDGGYWAATGPITVTYDNGNGPEDWYVYRTSFSGFGALSWQVTIVSE